jgi:hypothetical protein
MTATRPRNAAGRFAFDNVQGKKAPQARTAGERLQAAKDAVPKIERERDTVMVRRRECLLNDDVVGRRRCDYQLRELRDDLQAAHDKAELLGRVGPQEQTRATMPTDLPSVLAALSALEPELVRLSSIPWQARNAGQQNLLDSLVRRQYYLTGLAGRMRPAAGD